MIANIKFKFLEKLKIMRAEEHPKRENKSRFHDEEGKFVPYSTVISSEDQHNALMGLHAFKRIDDIHDAEKLLNMIKEINKEG
jgi:hypothetical protein